MISLSIFVVMVGVLSVMVRKSFFGVLISLHLVILGLISFFFFVGQANFKENGHSLAWVVFVVGELLLLLGYAYLARIAFFRRKKTRL